MPKKESNNPSGRDRSTQKSRTSLAARMRDLLRGERDEEGGIVDDFYFTIMEGKMPKLIRDANGKPLRVEADEAHAHLPPPTLDQRMLAAARVTERAYGQAAQHIQVEQEIRAEITAIAGGVDPKYLGKLTPEALKAIRDAVKALPAKTGAEGGEPEPSGDILDADFVEVPSEAQHG